MNFRERKPMSCGQNDRTVQSHAKQANINYIVERYQRTGDLPPNPRGVEPQYIDNTPYQEDVTDLHNSSLETIESITAEAEKALAEQNSAAPVKEEPEPDPLPVDNDPKPEE